MYIHLRPFTPSPKTPPTREIYSVTFAEPSPDESVPGGGGGGGDGGGGGFRVQGKSSLAEAYSRKLVRTGTHRMRVWGWCGSTYYIWLDTTNGDMRVWKTHCLRKFGPLFFARARSKRTKLNGITNCSLERKPGCRRNRKQVTKVTNLHSSVPVHTHASSSLFRVVFLCCAVCAGVVSFVLARALAMPLACAGKTCCVFVDYFPLFLQP